MSIKDPSNLDASGVETKEKMPEKNRKKRAFYTVLLRWIPAMVFSALLLVFLLLMLGGFYVWRTETGTRYAWAGAKTLSGNKLQGVLERGTLQKGIFLRDVKWHDADGEVSIDRIQSQWTLKRTTSSFWSWQWRVSFIRIGEIQLKQAVLPQNTKPIASNKIPQKLTLPFLLKIDEASVRRLSIVQGEHASEWTDLHLQFETTGQGKAQQHRLSLSHLGTPYGGLRMEGQLAAVTPFALSATAHLKAIPLFLGGKERQKNLKSSTNANGEAEYFEVRLSGSLVEMIAELTAHGRMLNGKGHIELRPFKKMPLKAANVSVKHFNPRIFSAKAPLADLHIEAMFGPAPIAQASDQSRTQKLKRAFKDSLTVSTHTVPGEPPFTVEGEVSLYNARPGSLVARKLPLRQARSHIRLNAQEQIFSGIRISLLQGPIAATPTFFQTPIKTQTAQKEDVVLKGEGRFTQGKGALNLHVQALNLHPWFALLAQTHLNGTLTWTLKPDAHQHTLSIDLKSQNSSQAQLQRIGVTALLKPDQIEWSSKLIAGRGQLQTSGVLEKEGPPNRPTYDIRSTLDQFSPFAWLHPAVRKQFIKHTQIRPVSLDTPDSQKTSLVFAKNALLPILSGYVNVRNHWKVFSPHPTQIKSLLEHIKHPFKEPEPSLYLEFALHDSVYQGRPLQAQGQIHTVGHRLLPSHLKLGVADNFLEARGELGNAVNQFKLDINAPDLSQISPSWAGKLKAQGELYGNLISPRLGLHYEAHALSAGGAYLRYMKGHAQLKEGANGALSWESDVRGLTLPQITLNNFHIHLTGTQAQHNLEVELTGQAQKQAIDFKSAIQGQLHISDTQAIQWEGRVMQFVNHGLPEVQLLAPVKLGWTLSKTKPTLLSEQKAARESQFALTALNMGHVQAQIEGAKLDMKALNYSPTQRDSSGTLTGLDVRHLSQRLHTSGIDVKTNLVLDSEWDIQTKGTSLKGSAQLHRRTGDLVLQTALGAPIPLDFRTLSARLEAVPKTGVAMRLQAHSGQFGQVSAHLTSPFDYLVLSNAQAFDLWKKTAPLSGEVAITLPTLDPIGQALGPNVSLSGSAHLNLKVGGTVAQPLLSGRLDADHLGSTWIEQGITFKDGIVRIAMSDNAIRFERVSFQGVKGTATLTGSAKIDPIHPARPVLDAYLRAQELAIFATLDRQLFLSGQASMHYSGPNLENEASHPWTIEGAFKVDRALFDLPNRTQPKLGDDVVEIDRALWKMRQAERKRARRAIAKQLDNERALPLTKIHIDLGHYCRFRGAGANLGLGGALEVHSAPGKPLQAKGDVQVLEGSTFEAFGRKLDIEKGYFSFYGPLDNPGIHILAMRRKQEVEAGVLVTGTLRSPDIRLVSEPNEPDSEKLSWLLFGHGSSGGTNLSQENTTMAALALLGNASGKRIAKTVGLDEFNIGPSESGIPDPQVIALAKVLNERFILGYEQSLSTAASLVKLTWQLSRRWSIAMHTGTLNGIDIIHHKRFDTLGE